MDGSHRHHPNPSAGNLYLYVAIFVLAAIFITGSYYIYSRRLVQSTLSTHQQSALQTAPVSDRSVLRTVSLEALDLSLEIPAGFTIHIEEPDPGRIYTAYIQNYPFNSPPPGPDAYQLYILWQKDKSISAAQFSQLKNDLQPGAFDTRVAGFPAISGQVKGERSRYVTYLLKDGIQVSMFTSEPTVANKAVTDGIVAGMKVDGEECGVCSQFMPPAPGFCADGEIVPGGTTACGCRLPPVCIGK